MTTIVVETRDTGGFVTCLNGNWKISGSGATPAEAIGEAIINHAAVKLGKAERPATSPKLEIRLIIK